MKKGAKKKKDKSCKTKRFYDSRKPYGILVIMLVIAFILLFILLFISYTLEPEKNEKGLNSLGTEESISVGNINSVCGNGICENGEDEVSCPQDCGYQICNNNGICEGVENNENCPNDCMGKPISPELKNIIDNTWENNRQEFIDNINDRLTNYSDAGILYYIEEYTINLLKYAEYTKDYQKIDELAGVYIEAYKYMNYSDGLKVWMCGQGLISNCTNGTAYSTYFLTMIQFHYALTSELEAIAEINPQNRTENMNEFASDYSNVSLDYLVIGSIGRGNNCEEYWMNLSEPMEDNNLWVVADSAEILMANNEDPGLVPISDSNKSYLLDYVNCSTFYLQKRLNESNLTDFSGNPVNGLLFDSGLQCTSQYNEDFLYSNYTGSIFPNETDKSCSPAVGWDISHGRRFVPFFETLYNARNVTNQNFPDDNTMNELANQIAYGVFNKNFTSPLFSNFLDGSNGWYNVNYDGPGDGFGPYGVSIYFAEGGYGFLSEFNHDLYDVMNSVWLIYKTPDKDNSTESLLENYYTSNPQYQEYEPKVYSIDSVKRSLNQSNSLTLLEFLPSLVSSKYCGNGICENSIDENCSTCPIDCGNCSTPNSNSSQEDDTDNGNFNAVINYSNHLENNTNVTLPVNKPVSNQSQNKTAAIEIPKENYDYLVYTMMILCVIFIIIIIALLLIRYFKNRVNKKEPKNVNDGNWEYIKRLE